MVGVLPQPLLRDEVGHRPGDGVRDHHEDGVLPRKQQGELPGRRAQGLSYAHFPRPLFCREDRQPEQPEARGEDGQSGEQGHEPAQQLIRTVEPFHVLVEEGIHEGDFGRGCLPHGFQVPQGFAGVPGNEPHGPVAGPSEGEDHRFDPLVEAPEVEVADHAYDLQLIVPQVYELVHGLSGRRPSQAPDRLFVEETSG